MKIETFKAIQREIARDPLTERQAAEISGLDSHRLLNSAEAAAMLGIAPETLRNKARRHEILKVKTNGRACLFRKSDIIKYIADKTI